MANLIFNPTNGQWINLDKPGGQVFFVDGGTPAYRGKGGSANNSGLRPEQALTGTTTSSSDGLNAVMDKVVSGRGDTIALLPGSITNTAVVTVDKNDVTFLGVGDTGGSTRASVIVGNLASTGDVFGVTGVGVTFENLQFSATTAACTSRINAGAAGLTIRNCTFLCGATDLLTITVEAAGTDFTAENCAFYVTANNPDSAIKLEGTSSRATIRNNVFDGGTNTNAWDVGAINSGAIHTGCLVENNTNHEGPSIIFSAAATGIIRNNHMGGHTLDAALDPGSCFSFNNYEADAIDESGALEPGTVAS